MLMLVYAKDASSNCLFVAKNSATIQACCFSPDARLIATASYLSGVQLCDSETGKLQKVFIGAFRGFVYRAIMSKTSADCGPILAASDYQSIKLWAVDTSKLVKTIVGATKGEAREENGDKHNNGNLVDGAITVRNVADTQQVSVWFDKETEMPVRCICFSTNGNFIAPTVGEIATIWNVKSGQILNRLPERDASSEEPSMGHSAAIHTLAFSPNSEFLATGFKDKTARIWAVRTGKLVAVLAFHAGSVNDVSFSADGTRLATASADKSIAIWKQTTPGSWSSGEVVKRPEQVLRGHNSDVWAVAFAPNSDLLVSGSFDGELRAWDTNTATGECPQEENPSPTSLELSPGHREDVIYVAISPDNNTVASGSSDGMVCLWDGRTGAMRQILSERHDGNVIGLVFSRTAKYLVSASIDNCSFVWELGSTGSTTKLKHTLDGHEDWLRGVAISPDEHLVATASDSGTVGLWNLEAATVTGQVPVSRFKGHSNYIYSVALSHDSMRLASAGDNRHVMVWKLAEPQTDKEKPDTDMSDVRVRESIRGVAFTPAGSSVLSVSSLGTVVLWRVDASNRAWCRLIIDEDYVGSPLRTFTSMHFDPHLPSVLMTEFGAWQYDMDDRPTPRDSDVPGGFPETPSMLSTREPSTPASYDLEPGVAVTTPRATEIQHVQPNQGTYFANITRPESQTLPALQQKASRSNSHASSSTLSAGATVVPEGHAAPVAAAGTLSTSESDSSLTSKDAVEHAPIKAAPTNNGDRQPLQRRRTIQTEDDLFRVLSQRRTGTSNGSDEDEEFQEIDRLMSRMFGRKRQEQSEEEKTRHTGVVFRNLTVKGVGLGASLQPTVGDIFMNPLRNVKNLLTKGPKAAAGKPPVRELISNFDGCVRPGELLLVLGRPGSGCSTFLKAFCNQTSGFEAVEGDVRYGGTGAKEMAKNFRGEIIYNPEDDLHYATLTVRRTLKFALQTRTPGKESRLEGESRTDYIKEFLRVVTKLFWIEHTLGTKVGNEFIRGVSGGERKRVSIAEAMITRASVQGWDNSSKGLDASTALEYVRSIRAMTNMAEASTAVSLYQAGESLFNLVDKVLLIDGGKCVYFGRADAAKQYFIDLGFECPERWTTPDFLTSVSDEHERSVRKGWEDRIPRNPEAFAEAYRNSEAYKRNLADIEDFESKLDQQMQEREQNESKKTSKKNYTVPFHKQVVACTKRQFLVMFGDRASLFGKWGGLLFQGLIVGSLFYNLPQTASGAFPRGGTLFFLLLFNALLALAEMTSAFESKPILLKHKSFSFYRPAAFAIAQTVVDVPLVFIQVVIFNTIIYFMANLSRTPSQYFITTLILWLVTMVTYAFFRTISSFSRTIDDATRITGVAIQILVVYTGYLIPPRSMHPWFSWLRWINWIQYGFEGLMANEFAFMSLQCDPPYLVPSLPDAEPQYQSCALQGSVPGETSVNGADYIQEAFSYSRAHLWRNVGFLCAFFIFFVSLTVLGMELMKPNAGGGAITVFKRGQVPKKVEASIETGGREKKRDEEDGGPTSHVTPDMAMTHGDAEKQSEEDPIQNVAKNETVFTFQNINYKIPYEHGERHLLQDIQGYVRPGKLTALMGASGAGKTTLLNALAQRLNFGTVEGDFLVDGRPLPKSFQRATGFAEQMDVHEPTATVREALQFSAILRQPKEVPKQEKLDYCETIIDLLEMRDIAGATIGKIGEGLNQEQRKRLTIGVELAAKPELLMFLDEPTSGLDSGAAFNIVRFLRKLADAGQAVLCTIHQPSAVLFEHFDELILLKSGGRIVYHGPLGKDSQELLHYFESHGAKSCPPNANPAEYMLEAIGAGDPNYDGQDWGDVWAESEQHEARSREIEEMISNRQHVEPSKGLKDDREYATPLSTQTLTVVKRTFVAYWRTPNYIIGKFMLHILTGLFNCFTFWKLGYTSIDYQNRLFSIFMTLTICPPLIQQLQPVFLNSRNIFQSRENNSKIYSWFAWVTAATLVEIPYAIVAGTIYYSAWWWGIFGTRVSSFTSGFAYLLMILFELYYVSFGQAIAAFAPNELLASLLVPLFFLFVVSFCGVVVPPQQLPTFWRSWMYWLSPFHYLVEGFLGAVIHDQPVECSTSEYARFSPPPNQSCENYVGPFIEQAGGYVRTGSDGLCEFCQYATGDEFGAGFSVYYSNIWRDFGIFCGFIVFNYFVIYVATWLRFKGKNPLKRVPKIKKKA
ncbi:ABC multidrug transporter atrF [Paramyrothecium foliicola]|nr:ABC multidrug transporter atrF [Paramyrothecium foliicola]